jgi:hypothetical protein
VPSASVVRSYNPQQPPQYRTHSAAECRTIIGMPVPIDELEAEARRAFAFLEAEFGCELERTEGERRSCRLEYRCETGFADVHLAEPDQAVAVYFGASGREPIPLWAVLDARGEPQPDPETNLGAWAEALRRHGTAALRGDTSGYSGLEEAYARRSAANQRDVQGRIREITEDRGSEGSLRRALRRLWGRVP